MTHPVDLEAQVAKLWADYRALRENHGLASAFDALRKRILALRSNAKKLGLRVQYQQLGDLQTYVSKAKAELLSPAERVREVWPPLCQTYLRDAISEGESALRSGTLASLRRAAALLKPMDRPESLADIAEEGIAADLAVHIPGATVDQGMLVLSAEHERCIQKATTLSSRIGAALANPR
jgi:hypothetical protein